MANKTLADEILTMIKTEANNNPAPETAKIYKTYENENYADILINDTLIKHLQCIGKPAIDDECIVVYADGTEPIVITGGGDGASINIDDEINENSRNPVQNRVIASALNNKVTKNDVDIILMDNGYLKLKLDLEEE